MEVRLLNGESNIAVVVDNTLNNKGITKVTFNERKQNIPPPADVIKDYSIEINTDYCIKKLCELGYTDKITNEEIHQIVEGRNEQ